MSRDATDIVTDLCKRIAGGDSAARDQLMTLVYDELLEIASRLLRGEPNTSLQTGDLANAAILKLVAGEGKALKRNRAYFFGAVARAMRQILIDRARKWRPPRSGTDPTCVSGPKEENQDGRLIALDEALNDLARYAERPARVVELCFFAGMTVKKIAKVLDISRPTVERDFRVARAFLRGKIGEYMDND